MQMILEEKEVLQLRQLVQRELTVVSGWKPKDPIPGDEKDAKRFMHQTDAVEKRREIAQSLARKFGVGAIFSGPEERDA